jgi:hypothetical protein
MAKRTHKDIVKEKLVATGLDLTKDNDILQEILEENTPDAIEEEKQSIKDGPIIKKIMDKYGNSLRPFIEEVSIEVLVDLSAVDDGDENISMTSPKYEDFLAAIAVALLKKPTVKAKLKKHTRICKEIQNLDLSNPCDVIYKLTKDPSEDSSENAPEGLFFY